MNARIRLLTGLLFASLAGCGERLPQEPAASPNDPHERSVDFIVDSVRTAFALPALAVAIVSLQDDDIAIAVAGTRRAAGGSLATADDLWHIGSNFKAFGGLLGAIAVERGAIAWGTTVSQAFPELAAAARAEYRDVTLRDLLSHQSGLPRDPPPNAVTGATRQEQRNAVAAWAMAQQPVNARGTYRYSNAGYIVAGAMLERALGMSYESAMQALVFGPLGVADAGFGPQAAAGSASQPVAHTYSDAGWIALENWDNPPVYSSAGGAHMSIGSWARFIGEVLRVEAGTPTLVSAAAGMETTAPAVSISGSDSYALGWVVTSRAWASGRVLFHDGTNTGNHSVAWLASGRGFGVIAVTNAYDGTASARTARALDVLAARLIVLHDTGR